MEKKRHSSHSDGEMRRNRIGIRFCLLFCLLCMTLGVFGQQKKLSFNWTETPLLEVLNTLEKSDVYKFMFNSESLRPYKVTASVKEQTVLQILDKVLAELPFTYKEDGVFILIRRKEGGQEKEQGNLVVKGKVLDEKGLPLPGVTVRLDSTTIGTSTAVDGTFNLPVPKKNGQLVFSFVGCDTKKVVFSAGQELVVTLKESASELDEVVVRAYGTQNKREMISAISTVNAEEMKELPSASITSMLQGRLAGLNVIQQSGAPGSAAVVSVRGFNSLLVDGASDGQPLWVVDGVPMHSFVSPVTGTNTLADLDPSMIESVQVLKDAAAASIYGSRAGNGVILITTKKGREGKAKFAANVSYSLSQLMAWPLQTGGRMERWLDLNHARHQIESYWSSKKGAYCYPSSYEDVFYNSSAWSGTYDKFWGNGKNDVGTDYQLQDSLDPFYNNERNWWKQIFRTGKVVDANIQASGGSDKFQYMVGAGLYDETGIMINSIYKRANMRVNLNANLTDKLHADARVYLSYVDRSMNKSVNNYDGMEVAPDKQPTYMGGSKELEDEWLERMKYVKDRTDDYRAMASMFLEWELLKGLSLSASGSVDYAQANLNMFYPSNLDEEYHRNRSTGSVNRVVSIMTEELLHYSKSFNETHNFDLLLGINANKEQNFGMSGAGMGAPSDYTYYFNPSWVKPVIDVGKDGYHNYISNTTYASDFTEKVMVSYFGRIGYNYKQRYLAEFTFRRDGSSTFGEGNRWANFPSVAVGWAFSEEPFIKRFTEGWLNWGKIRGSYGTSGQTFTKAYLAYGLIGVDSYNSFMGNFGTTPSSPIARDLTWEKTEQYDLGLDLDMFDYRLNVKLDYYYKYTSSLIYQVPLPAALYLHSSRTENAMEVSNEGIELELTADILREGPVSWRSKLNLSRNWNRLEKSYSGKDLGGLVIGRPLSMMLVTKNEGFYEKEEDFDIYYKENGQRTYILGTLVSDGYQNSGLMGFYKFADFDHDGRVDQYYAGSPLPVAYGGWVNEVIWKNFDLNVLFNFSFGRKMINGRNTSLSKKGPKFADYKDLHYWTEPGCKANLPRLGESVAVFFDTNIETVHSMSLKQITLGYNMPNELIKKVGFSGARVFVTAENLFYLSNYSGDNPEVVDLYSGHDSGTSYPLPRKWTFGLTLNF
ncbi:SusC/RagA family TonB-linked outer membrane protein [Butyricimonas synergistica]|uniref:SusC/RagA family TonB-linked outer membrane protein n=1 Tax=Butyricimonas synergistica TaxID=544644 RepID=UPI0003A47BC2|nr:SusC/RagA family TonB-linked outer membrane protein [Butyricimonas synergistica]